MCDAAEEDTIPPFTVICSLQPRSSLLMRFVYLTRCNRSQRVLLYLSRIAFHGWKLVRVGRSELPSLGEYAILVLIWEFPRPTNLSLIRVAGSPRRGDADAL